MEIKCPLHHSVLQLKKEKLHMLGKQTELITGRCEKCRQVYVDRKLFSSTNTFTANSVEYEFLEELVGVKLPEQKSENNHPYIRNEKDSAADKMCLDVDEILHQEDPNEKKPESQRKANLQIEKEKATLEKINLTENRITSKTRREYRAEKVHCQRVGMVCPVCGEELIHVERVRFTIDGVAFKCSGMCCTKCRSVYLSEKMKKRIETEIENSRQLKKNGAYAPKNRIVYKPSIMEKQQQREKALETIPGDAPKCVLREATVPTELTTATLRSERGKEIRITIVRDERYQNSAENIYWQDRSISRSILKAISTGKPWLSFKDVSYKVIDYGSSGELSEMLGTDGETNADGAADTIWIYKAKIPCPSHSEQVEAVTAYVFSLEDNLRHPIDVCYCRRCKKYYINEMSFNMFCSKYGMPLIKLAVSGAGSYGDYSTWQEESVLHFLGYNVNAGENLSDEVRHKILAGAMEAGMHKPKIIAFLENRIMLAKSQPRNADAVVKWKKDLKFVHEYRMDKQRKVKGTIRRVRC